MDQNTETNVSISDIVEAIKNKIRDEVLRLNNTGLNHSDREILKNRLKLCWYEPGDEPPRKKTTTQWRNSHAKTTYIAIQDINQHLFLGFVLQVTPTDCAQKGFLAASNHLACLDSFEPYVLKLKLKDYNFFESIAAKAGFTGNRRYIDFMRALFPIRKSTRCTEIHHSLPRRRDQTDVLHEFIPIEILTSLQTRKRKDGLP